MAQQEQSWFCVVCRTSSLIVPSPRLPHKAKFLKPIGLVVGACILDGSYHAGRRGQMIETTNAAKKPRLPDTPSHMVRQRWLELLDLSYSTRRVTQQEIEPGVHAVVVPAACRKEAKQDLVEIEMRVASSQVPGMARGVRLSFGRLGEFALTLAADYHGWMGIWGRD